MAPTPPPGSAGRHRVLLALATAAGISGPLCANPAADTAAERKLRANCRIEGEAGGLSDAALEGFITQCIADLNTVEIRHIDGD